MPESLLLFDAIQYYQQERGADVYYRAYRVGDEERKKKKRGKKALSIYAIYTAESLKFLDPTGAIKHAQ